jgi:uncharacterized RDD family membrane protein YckC
MSLPRAGFWIRLSAALIDGVAALVVMIAVSASLYSAGISIERSNAAAFAALLPYTMLEILTRGTPGKLLLGLRIARADGSPADFWRLCLRWSTKQGPMIFQILYLLTRFPAFYLIGGFYGLVVFVGCFYASNDDKLAWHDQWAGTAVMHKRALQSAPRIRSA